LIFSYACGCDNGAEEKEFKVGEAPTDLGQCPFCQQKIKRDFGTDVQTMQLGVIDPYRTYALSSRKMSEEARQQRRIGGPQDNTERRKLESQHGIQYVGNDTSGFSAKARRGIEQYQAKKRYGEVD